MSLRPRLPRTPVDAVLRLVTATALTIDAVLHLQLARVYNLAAPGGIGEGTLFRLESVVALIAAALVLGFGGRVAYGLAFVVAASATGAALLYRYVDVPALGPIPAMYEPVWFGKKIVATAAETIGTVTATLGLLTRTSPEPAVLSVASPPEAGRRG